jgi:AcrR family transcriptional regulator
MDGKTRDVFAKRRSPVGATTHAKRRDEAAQRMLAAAAEIISVHGVDGLTLAEVGTAAGYSRGLPAHYFGNKTGLLEAVATYIVDEFANHLAETSQFRPGLESLLGSIETFLSVKARSRKHATALQAVIAESLSEVALQPAMAALNKRSIRRLAGTIRAAIANGEVRQDIDDETTAIMILGALRSIITMWLIDPGAFDLDDVRSAFAASVTLALAT